MIDRLPYPLIAGVTATREGLVITEDNRELYILAKHDYRSERLGPGVRRFQWYHAAERLRYRGEGPGIQCDPWGNLSLIASSESANLLSERLHRLAAIICDDAEAFHVLHWCIENLGAE